MLLSWAQMACAHTRAHMARDSELHLTPAFYCGEGLHFRDTLRPRLFQTWTHLLGHRPCLFNSLQVSGAEVTRHW